MKSIRIKPTVNKANGQINFSLPKKKLPLKISDNAKDIKYFKVKITDWEMVE